MTASTTNVRATQDGRASGAKNQTVPAHLTAATTVTVTAPRQLRSVSVTTAGWDETVVNSVCTEINTQLAVRTAPVTVAGSVRNATLSARTMAVSLMELVCAMLAGEVQCATSQDVQVNYYSFFWRKHFHKYARIS